MLDGKKVLVTGGTGSFGRAFVSEVLTRYPKIKRLVVLSRDEMKQYEMAQEFSPEQYPAIRYFLGDVRDRSRLRRAFAGIDVIVHAAALKQVPAAEYNPMEFIRTNVTGAENVIEASIDAQVGRVVALSTDKAAAPVNLYGATKLCSDKLFIAANDYAGNGPRFSVARYGNVMGSRGSVIPFFLEKAKAGFLPITDERMTRFNLTIKSGVALVLWAIEHSVGGEILIPKIPSYRITDLAEAIGPSCKRTIVGIRPGEKLHEEMITSSDSLNAIEIGDKYVIVPSRASRQARFYFSEFGGKNVGEGFSYSSDLNTDFLSVGDIRQQILDNLDPTFSPI